MKLVECISDLRREVAFLKKSGSVCFVPTMGYLHKGHVSLMEFAKTMFDYVVVSTFVNPAQFSEGEDYLSYPRDAVLDFEKCISAGVDILYAPSVLEMYPSDFSIAIDIGPKAREMCGKSRVNFFNGIMLVVAKLMLQVMPSALMFGEKDYQMFFLIKRFMRNMDFDVEIVSGKTIREPDGLACSSRNVYLSENERIIASSIYVALSEISKMLKQGMQIDDVVDYSKQFLSKLGFNVDYIEVRSNNSLERMLRFDEDARVFCAAYLGKCRLIDNLFVELI